MAAFQAVVFKLGKEVYGIDITHISAIENSVEIVRVPNSSGNIKGIINLRGEVIPVVDLKSKFSMSDTSYGENGSLIIVRNAGRKIALEVDGVDRIANLEDKDVVEMPIVAKNEELDYFSRVAKVDGRLVIIVEPNKLITESESQAIDNLINE